MGIKTETAAVARLGAIKAEAVELTKIITLSQRRDLFNEGLLRNLRRLIGLNQSEFWTPIGVTQSGGSRYETGRDIPAPVMLLVRLRWVEGIDIDGIKRDEVADHRRMSMGRTGNA